MYPQKEIHRLQKLTDRLFEEKGETHLLPKQLSELKEVLRFHEYRYYIDNDPLVSDFEYDVLFKELERLEKENPALITPDSPTQRQSNALTREFKTVQHLVPMLSLENSYNPDDLVDWDRKNRESTGIKEIEYCVEPKFDGASISLIYDNDQLVRGATRGDGVAGDDITANIRQIRSVPLSAPFQKIGIQQIEIRGEVLMNKNNFKKYNDALAEQNLAPLANPRNAAAGSLRIKDPAEVRRRNLEVFLYHISYYSLSRGAKTPGALQQHGASLDTLMALGFRTPAKEKKVLKGIQAVIDYCENYEARRDELGYEIDGMVIKVNDLELQDRLGMTSHHPRWAMAFKFKARQATSTLKAVEFQVGRTGSITPVAKIDPVPIGGVTVGSVSLFNQDVITEKDLRIGDTVLVERAGDVIPYIVKPMTDVRTGKETPIAFPEKCPVCREKLVRQADEAAWRCININCEAQVLERIIHFGSKDAMDIRGFGEANIRKFYMLGFLKHIPGIYTLPYDKIRTLEGFGEKSILNLQTSVENSKGQPLHRLIFALGLRYVGETTAKTLAHAVNDIRELKDFSLEDLQMLEDIGPKVASSVFEFFRNRDNLEMIEQLGKCGVQLTSTGKQVPGDASLGGKTFLFTGTLPTLKRSEAEELVEQHGGQILSGVSSKLDYLVVGDDAGSKLEKAKKISTVKILSEKNFLALLKK